MKPLSIFSFFLGIIVVLSGCVTSGSAPDIDSIIPVLESPTVTSVPAATPTLTATRLPFASPTPTSVPTLAPAPTLPATLAPEQGEEAIRSLLQEPEDCPAPCFWGIVPGQTTLSEARDIFTHLGLEMASTAYRGKDYHGIRYDFESGLSVIVTLTIRDEIVENLSIDIIPEKPQPNIPRKWLAYSPLDF